MTSTTFVNGQTLTDEDWFNDINRLHYTLLNDPTTTLSIAQAIAPSISSLGSLQVTGVLSVSSTAALANVQVGGTLSVSAQAVVNALQVGGALSATSIAGAVIATQAQMESAVSTGAASATLIVTPARFQYHPGAAKAWVRFDGTATSVTAGAAYNIASITDKGTGNYNIIFATPFSSNLFAPDVSCSLYNIKLTSISAASVEVTCLDLSGTAADASIVTMIAFGDQ